MPRQGSYGKLQKEVTGVLIAVAVLTRVYDMMSAVPQSDLPAKNSMVNSRLTSERNQ